MAFKQWENVGRVHVGPPLVEGGVPDQGNQADRESWATSHNAMFFQVTGGRIYAYGAIADTGNAGNGSDNIWMALNQRHIDHWEKVGSVHVGPHLVEGGVPDQGNQADRESWATSHNAMFFQVTGGRIYAYGAIAEGGGSDKGNAEKGGDNVWMASK
jgi:hypothetical protein